MRKSLQQELLAAVTDGAVEEGDGFLIFPSRYAFLRAIAEVAYEAGEDHEYEIVKQISQLRIKDFGECVEVV